MVFFCNFTSFTNASPFETPVPVKEKLRLRLPSSVAQPVIHFDCTHPVENIEISTSFETVRLEALNCAAKVGFKNEKHPQDLVIFPMGPEKFASEYAYLKDGANHFEITANSKSYKISVTRFQLTAPH